MFDRRFSCPGGLGWVLASTLSTWYGTRVLGGAVQLRGDWRGTDGTRMNEHTWDTRGYVTSGTITSRCTSSRASTTRSRRLQRRIPSLSKRGAGTESVSLGQSRTGSVQAFCLSPHGGHAADEARCGLAASTPHVAAAGRGGPRWRVIRLAQLVHAQGVLDKLGAGDHEERLPHAEPPARDDPLEQPPHLAHGRVCGAAPSVRPGVVEASPSRAVWRWDPLGATDPAGTLTPFSRTTIAITCVAPRPSRTARSQLS